VLAANQKSSSAREECSLISNMRHDTHPVLDVRSVVVAIVVLLVGGALGFGVGYKYEKHTKSASTHSAAAHSTTTTTTKKKSQPSATQTAEVKAALALCMAGKGVKYPSPDADLSHPPAGVSQATFESARLACYKDLLNSRRG
jgi:hypothetical protein